MIDAHMHVVDSGLPGPELPEDRLFTGPPDILAEVVRGQMRDARVDHALSMGRWAAPDDDPLGVNGVLRLATLVPGLHAIGIADPSRSDRGHIRRADEQVRTRPIKAIKFYLGYLPYGPDHPGYRPYYELAEARDIPVIFHTGDTYSTVARLKFARPLPIDDVAVDHPKLKIVMAHMGNPWLLDAAEVIYKNPNVWADLSGLLVGEADYFRDEEKRQGIEDMIARVAEAVRFTEKFDRILYGSDWPLVPMAPYRDVVRRIIPGPHLDAVFDENARALFRIS